MSKAVGGYIRRSDRRYVPPAPDDDTPRCGNCKARIDIITPWNQPHICKELTIGTAPIPYHAEIYPDTGNQGCYLPIEDAEP